jgi:hypothetical protein
MTRTVAKVLRSRFFIIAPEGSENCPVRVLADATASFRVPNRLVRAVVSLRPFWLSLNVPVEAERYASRPVVPPLRVPLPSPFVAIAVSSMVVGEFNLFGSAIAPDEAHSKLIVDPDRMLSLAVAL